MKVDLIPDPSLYPFQPRWFDSYAGRLHYIDEGQARRSCTATSVSRLRGQFRCVAVDYLGFGLSERPDAFGYTIEVHARGVGDFVDHRQLDGFITMGQDWGGPVSMAVGTARAEHIRGVILGNTWFWPADQLGMKLFSRVMSTPVDVAVDSGEELLSRADRALDGAPPDTF